MVTYDWKISNLERDIATGGVIKIHWSCTASKFGTGVSTGGAKELRPNADDPAFIPYDSLTKDQVMAWLHENDKEVVESALLVRLNETITPSTATGLPWSNAPVEE